MSVFVVVRTTDENGSPEYAPVSVFSSLEAAEREANVIGRIYNVELHELILDQHQLIPQGSMTIARAE